MKLRTRPLPLLGVLLLVVVVGSRTVPHYGVSWDEPHSSGFADFNAQEAAVFIGLGEAQDPARFAGVVDVTRTYPPAIELLHNAASYAWLWLHSPNRPNRMALKAYNSRFPHFVVRHYVTFGLSVVGYVALWATARQLGLAGFWALAPVLLLASAPTYWGHSQFNSKDSGFASAFTIAMWSASWAIPALLGMDESRRRWLVRVLLLGVATGWATGGRLAGGLVLIVVWLAAVWTRPAAVRDGAFWARLAVAGLTAVATLLVFWPALWADPLPRLLSAAMAAGRFPGPQTVLFWGTETATAALPSYYVSAVLAVKLPEVLVGLGGIGLVAALLARPSDTAERARLRLVFLWFVVPAAYVALFHVRLYDNERHVLFLVPSLAILSGWVLSRVATRSPALRVAAVGAVLVTLLLNVRTSWRLHPYEYTDFNTFVGGLRGAEGRFATDYWGLSTRELLDSVPRPPTRETTVRVCMVTAAARVMAPPGLVVVPETAPRADFTVCGSRWELHRKWLETEDLVAAASRDGVVFGVLTRPR
jgi:hypothetical protein